MKIIRLNFNSPLHVGEIGIGLEECSPIIHSDTIFNAIINAYALMHSEEQTDVFVEKFEAVKISSAFPHFDDDILFPKPRININTKIDVSDYAKELKRTEYISKGYFEKIINNEEFSKEEIEELIKEREFFKDYQIPKVYLDRETKESDFFFISLIKFKEDCGLWFSIECENGVYKDICSCLRLLQDEGIGGKRTWGYGLFEFREDDIDIRLPNKPNMHLLLSLFYPNENENALFNGENASWDFVIRGGWRKTGIRKPRIKMIKEGSVFDSMPIGKILKFDTLKFHHYGLAYTIPMVRREKEDEK